MPRTPTRLDRAKKKAMSEKKNTKHSTNNGNMACYRFSTCIDIFYRCVSVNDCDHVFRLLSTLPHHFKRFDISTK